MNNSVPGFKAIPAAILATPKPVLMSPRELARTLRALLQMGLIQTVTTGGGADGALAIRYKPTEKGKRVMGRSE